MLKKTITYEDYNGETQTEDFFFNLTRAELMEMELKTEGGMEQMIDKMTKEEDTAKIIEMFKEIIITAYGVKSLDGKKFRKRQEDKEDFLDSAAYDALFVELISNPDEAAAFVSGIIPSDVSEQAKAEMNKKIEEVKQNSDN